MSPKVTINLLLFWGNLLTDAANAWDGFAGDFMTKGDMAQAVGGKLGILHPV